MATVRRSLSLVALAISCAVYGDDHYEVNFGTQIGTATPRPRPAGPAPTDDDGLPDTINWEASTGGSGSAEQPRMDKDLSRAAPRPREVLVHAGLLG